MLDYNDFYELLDIPQEELDDFIEYLKKEIPDKVSWYYFRYHESPKRPFGASILVSTKGDLIYLNYFKYINKGKKLEKCFIKRRVEYQDIEINYEEDKEVIPVQHLRKKNIITLIDKLLLDKNNKLAPSYT